MEKKKSISINITGWQLLLSTQLKTPEAFSLWKGDDTWRRGDKCFLFGVPQRKQQVEDTVFKAQILQHWGCRYSQLHAVQDWSQHAANLTNYIFIPRPRDRWRQAIRTGYKTSILMSTYQIMSSNWCILSNSVKYQRTFGQFHLIFPGYSSFKVAFTVNLFALVN